MAKVMVSYQGGVSRYAADKAIDYMIASAEVNGEKIELYAEAENPTWDEDKEKFEDEAATYQELKDEILRQARNAGVIESDLDFVYG